MDSEWTSVIRDDLKTCPWCDSPPSERSVREPPTVIHLPNGGFNAGIRFVKLFVKPTFLRLGRRQSKLGRLVMQRDEALAILSGPLDQRCDLVALTPAAIDAVKWALAEIERLSSIPNVKCAEASDASERTVLLLKLAEAEQRIVALAECRKCRGRGWLERQMQTAFSDVMFAQSVGFEMPENEREKFDCSCVAAVRVDMRVAALQASIAAKDAALARIVAELERMNSAIVPQWGKPDYDRALSELWHIARDARKGGGE